MRCPRCHSDNVTVSVVSEQKLKKEGHGCLWWLFIGWWLMPALWFFATLPMIILKVFRIGNRQIVTKHKAAYACQNCGHTWVK